MPKGEPVQLNLLGRFAIRTGGAPPEPIRISSQKGRALLAYLAMQRGQSVSRERLSTLLWGDHLDTRARHNLRQCLLTLRADLGPVASDLLILEGDELCLRTELVTVDAVEFEALAKSTELPDLERAAALYRGEFLAGFTLEAEPFDDWIRAERARLEAIAARVFETCAVRLDAIGNGERAIEAAERLVALDTLREDWQRRLLLLYARYRSCADALAHGRSVTALLKSELDVGPELATTALIDEIKRNAIAPPPPSSPAVAEAPAAGGNLVQPDATVAMAMREQPRRRAAFFRPIAGMAFVALACIAGTVGFFLLSREGSKPVDSATPATPSVSVDQAAIDQSWRSPSILSGVAVDKAALADRGLIPLVVLPFRTYGGHGSDQMIAEQITDDLINDLSRTSALRVISGHTSRLYRDRPIDVAAHQCRPGRYDHSVAGMVRSLRAREV